MEQPQYGRTGLLESNRGGLPVRQPRLLHSLSAANGVSPSPPQLRWYPTMLTVPQQLLCHLLEGETVDRTFATFLRMACLVETCHRGCGLANDRHATARLTELVLRWHASRMDAVSDMTEDSDAVEVLSWYLPSYKVMVMKDGQVVSSIPQVSQRSVTLLGKDHILNDAFLDHPSCSLQHAAFEVRLVLTVEEEMQRAFVNEAGGSSTVKGLPSDDTMMTRILNALYDRLRALEVAGGGLSSLWALELQVIDLGSTNGTFVNAERLQPYVAVTLIEGDVITFGVSTRRYVVVRSTG